MVDVLQGLFEPGFQIKFRQRKEGPNLLRICCFRTDALLLPVFEVIKTGVSYCPSQIGPDIADAFLLNGEPAQQCFLYDVFRIFLTLHDGHGDPVQQRVKFFQRWGGEHPAKVGSTEFRCSHQM